MLFLFLLTIFTDFHTSVNAIHSCTDKTELRHIKEFGLKKFYIIFELNHNRDYNRESCIYTDILQTVPVVILKENKLNNMNQTVLKKCYLSRTNDIGIILIIDEFDIQIILKSVFKDIISRHNYALNIILIKSVECNVTQAQLFLKELLLRIKMVNVYIIVQMNATSTVLTYDTDNCDYEIFGCGIRNLTNEDLKLFKYNINKKKLTVNYPVRIVMFQQKAVNMKYINPELELFKILYKRMNNYVGSDAFTMGDIVSYFKFKPIILEFDDVQPFGFVTANGNITGTLRMIMEHEADISLNSRFITAYGYDEEYYFIAYNSMDRICAIAPKSDRVPIWSNFIHIYSIHIWVLMFMLIGLTAFLRWISDRFLLKGHKVLAEIVIDTFFSVLIPIHKLALSRNRSLLIGCFVINVILISIIQGKMRSLFTNVKYYDDVHTLKSFDDKYDTILTPFVSDTLLFGPDGDVNEVMANIKKKIIYGNYFTEDLLVRVAKKEIAIVAREDDVRLFLCQFSDEVHIVNDCLMQYILAFIASVNFPWSKEIESANLRLVASGIPSWYEEMFQLHLKLKLKNCENEIGNTVRTLSMSDFRDFFFIFECGIGFSVVVLIIEIVFYRSRKCLHKIVIDYR